MALGTAATHIDWVVLGGGDTRVLSDIGWGARLSEVLRGRFRAFFSFLFGAGWTWQKLHVTAPNG